MVIVFHMGINCSVLALSIWTLHTNPTVNVRGISEWLRSANWFPYKSRVLLLTRLWPGWRTTSWPEGSNQLCECRLNPPSLQGPELFGFWKRHKVRTWSKDIRFSGNKENHAECTNTSNSGDNSPVSSSVDRANQNQSRQSFSGEPTNEHYPIDS